MRHAHGFTLVEVLVALLVLGIGLLGVAGLQSATLGLNHGSYVRSQATILSQDIVDRMRANPTALSNGTYDQGAASTHANCEMTGGCSVQEMAEHDLQEWNTAVAGELPNGQGIVCIDGTPNDGDGPGVAVNECDGAAGANRVIKIWWYSKDEDEIHRFVTEVRPR